MILIYKLSYFVEKRYKSLYDFTLDPDYCKVLRVPIQKTTTETIKESKYADETELMRLSKGK